MNTDANPQGYYDPTRYQADDVKRNHRVRLRRWSKPGCAERDIYIDASQREFIAMLEASGYRRLSG